MRTQPTLFLRHFFAQALVFSLLMVPTPAMGDVVISFGNGLQGFSSESPFVGVTHSSEFGGSMKITSPGGVSTFDPRLDDAFLSFSSGSAAQVELAAAQINGGTISFDIHLVANEQQRLETAASTHFEIALVTAGAFTDRSITSVALPSENGTTSVNASFNIVPSEDVPNISDSELAYEDNGSGRIGFGLHDAGAEPEFEVGVFYIDNVTISAIPVVAVPEPSSATLIALGILGIPALSRRRKSNR